MTIAEKINQGKTYLGIELGSTRIKASLIDDTFVPIASGSHCWENKFENGFWTYSLEEIHKGVRCCYADLVNDVTQKYGVNITTVGAIGISAMMHGYMAFDEDNNLLTPFRTWRNTTTAQAANELTELFGFNIPQRWSIAHLYQAILNEEQHISSLSYINTLAGYIHYLLTGRKEVGIGEASGMFPIKNGKYDQACESLINQKFEEKGFDKKLCDVLPKICTAGESGAVLTEQGAAFLDRSGSLKSGIPLCAPEGDAGTGMVATNSVRAETGNVSAGTSVFSMLVLDKPLQNYYTEIDMVTTPDGLPVAMVHCNNCCGELDAWVDMFGEFAEISGNPIERSQLYQLLYTNAMKSTAGNDELVAYNYISGEPVADVASGRPMYFRSGECKLSLGSFFRAQLYSSVAALKIGMEILFDKENVLVQGFTAHGGLFKVKDVAQQILADAFNTTVKTMQTAGEGGAWGMALLAAYMINGKGMSLADFLDNSVFSQMQTYELSPDAKGSADFNNFMLNYKNGLKAQRLTSE